MNNSSYPMVNQSEHKRRSLFNLEGAIERLCTFKRGKEKISILMPCSYGGVAQLGEHLPCTQGVKGSSPLFSTICNYLYAGWQQGNCNCTLKTE